MQVTIVLEESTGNVSVKSDEKANLHNIMWALESAKHIIIHQAGMVPAMPLQQNRPVMKGNKQKNKDVNDKSGS